MSKLLGHDARNYGQDLEVVTHSDVPLRLREGAAKELLNVVDFKHCPTEELIALAKRRIMGRIHVSDRATAIAVLLG